ncbi:CopD family protein [Aquimarina rhabdastrellae]
MNDFYPYIKSLHLIFVITWFAGLFYIPRLFIYHIEAYDKPNPDKDILSQQFKLMTKRLWFIITWPSAILTTITAIILLIMFPAWLQQPWMHIKLGFVVLLYAYHLKSHQIYNQLQNDIVKWTSHQMRIWNEGSTMILFAVIFLVIVKDATNWIYGVLGLFLLAILLMLGIRLYKRIRQKNPNA